LLGWLKGLVKVGSLFDFVFQTQQKRYRYTGKERDDSSGLSYYDARYLAPWLVRWISPDSAGAADGLNLYVYVGMGENKLQLLAPHFCFLMLWRNLYWRLSS
jgi:RHS repeat-associated protein